jgi:2-polyprenyl-3-methyl-5-hydroxy-6-metoxy-1,4-benzoquinol methylase
LPENRLNCQRRKNPAQDFGTDIPSGLLHKNLRELDFLNRITGGHAISLKGIKQLITDRNKTYHIVDFGCGSGDALRAIADWARLNNYRVRLTGVDINVNAISYLKIHCSNYPEISGVTADYLDYLSSNESIDIVHCALFCHHLNDDELIRLLIYFRQHVKTGFIISDLRRHWLAYYSAYFFTRLLNGTKLAKNDGPISVLRGFLPVELVRMLMIAGIRNYFIQKSWGFRILIIGITGEHEGI